MAARSTVGQMLRVNFSAITTYFTLKYGSPSDEGYLTIKPESQGSDEAKIQVDHFMANSRRIVADFRRLIERVGNAEASSCVPEQREQLIQALKALQFAESVFLCIEEGVMRMGEERLMKMLCQREGGVEDDNRFVTWFIKTPVGVVLVRATCVMALAMDYVYYATLKVGNGIANTRRLWIMSHLEKALSSPLVDSTVLSLVAIKAGDAVDASLADWQTTMETILDEFLQEA